MSPLQPVVHRAPSGELQVLLDYAGETILVNVFPKCGVEMCSRCHTILTYLDPAPLCDHVLMAREAIAALKETA